MKWLGLILAGPTLWAITFVTVYALHGYVCADATGPQALGAGARAALVGAWITGLAAFWPLSRTMPNGSDLSARIAHAGLWIGLVATAFTLFPVAFVTSC